MTTGTSGKPDPKKRMKFSLKGSHKNYSMIEYGNNFYGVPEKRIPIDFLGAEELKHPSTLIEPSLPALQKRIDSITIQNTASLSIKAQQNYCILKFKQHYHAILNCFFPANAKDTKFFKQNSITSSSNENTTFHQTDYKTTVEYAGWLPAYTKFGDCGNHPQFLHTQTPPKGYRFSRTYDSHFERSTVLQTRLIRKAVKLFRKTSHIWPKLILTFSSLWHGAQLKHILEFFDSREKKSQLMLPVYSDLVFLPSVPFTYNQHPWVIEIEDCISLFFPYIHNGDTQNLNFLKSPYYPILKALLESQNCRRIITHIRSTATGIPKLFRNKLLENKISYIPFGVHIPTHYADHSNSSHCIELLFTNSWHQNPNSFYLRGGLDVLEAYKTLSKKYPQLRLTLRTLLPKTLDKPYLDIIKNSNTRVIDKFLSKEEMQDLSTHSHIFLIPSARVHVVSVLMAMAYGLAVIVSDGWGMEDYVKHEENGLVAKGRYGRVTWNDSTEGTLRENYSPMFSTDPKIANQLVKYISRLVEKPSLRAQLGRNARQSIKKNFNIDLWNQHLEDALNKALRKDKP